MTPERIAVVLLALAGEAGRRKAGVPPDPRFDLAFDVLGDLLEELER